MGKLINGGRTRIAHVPPFPINIHREFCIGKRVVVLVKASHSINIDQRAILRNYYFATRSISSCPNSCSSCCSLQFTGTISLKKWCQIMEKVLNLKLPWRTLQPHLCKMIQDTYQVEYKTTFQKIMVSHTVAKVSDYFTSEDFFSVVTENIKCELLSPSVGTTAKSVLINVKASVR